MIGAAVAWLVACAIAALAVVRGRRAAPTLYQRCLAVHMASSEPARSRR